MASKRKPRQQYEPEIEDLAGPNRPRNKRQCIALQHNQEAHAFSDTQAQHVQANLVEWYDAHRRKLPWRGDPPPYIATAVHTKQTSASRGKGGPLDAFFAATTKRSDAKKTKQVEPIPAATEEPTAMAVPASRQVSPYETWVSEVMLQQTRVDTVIDYFVQWIAAFPTLKALAEASEEDVNARWAGLGYYRRARMLHAGAQYVVDHFNGELPSSIEQLRTIPGIGPYTAGAIASIAFGQREPLVDGNVIRVLSRLRAVGADPKNKSMIDFAWRVSRELVERCDRPGAFNQAVMELGATVCTIQTPECASCPVRSYCIAYEEAQQKQSRLGNMDDAEDARCDLCDFDRVNEWDGHGDGGFAVTRYPLKAKKADAKKEAICVAVVSYPDQDAQAEAQDDDGPTWKYLMVRRPDNGLLAGQWEFVHSKIADSDAVPPYSKRKAHMQSKLVDLLGPTASWTKAAVQRRDLGQLVHVFSHVKHFMGIEHLHFAHKPKETTSQSGAIADDQMRWLSVPEMTRLGITTGVKKILQLVQKAN